MITMRIEKAIKSIHAVPKRWVRVAQVRYMPNRLELFLTIHEERPGRPKVDAWTIFCVGVRETHVTDFDGGGLALHKSTHPAGRQYTARRAVLRWDSRGDTVTMLGALYRAHVDIADDWIAFDRYAFGPWTRPALTKNKLVLRGPDFLMRAYAKALHANGESPRLRIQPRRKRKPGALRTLHFGGSFVVAAQFTAEHSSQARSNKVVT
jgi:hypothetical protein